MDSLSVLGEIDSWSGSPRWLADWTRAPGELRLVSEIDPGDTKIVQLPSGLVVCAIESPAPDGEHDRRERKVRVAAAMAYRIVAENLGLEVWEGSESGRVEIDDWLLGGSLASLTPSRFRGSLEGHVPDRLSGRDFLRRYSGCTDARARVDADVDYPVRCAARFVVEEGHRVRLFEALCRLERGALASSLLGELLLQSHVDASTCGLVSDVIERIADGVRQLGAEGGVHGVRSSGASAVVVLADRSARRDLDALSFRAGKSVGAPLSLRWPGASD